MGRTAHLPLHDMVNLYGKLEGTYTNRPMDAMGVGFLVANEGRLSLGIPNEICNDPVGHWHPGLPPNRYVFHDILLLKLEKEPPTKRIYTPENKHGYPK